MKRKGASILFFNKKRQVLLFLRDETPEIPYPNMWDVPGGHIETNESLEQCIIREMKEEMELDLEDFHPFQAFDFDDRIEYTFWKYFNANIEDIHLHEGQCLRWFTQKEAKDTKLAYGSNHIVETFFKSSLLNTILNPFLLIL